MDTHNNCLGTWDWAGHHFRLYPDYMDRSHHYLVHVLVPKSSDAGCVEDAPLPISLVCSIQKPAQVISLDDILDSFARKAQKKMGSGKRLGSSHALLLGLHRLRRIEKVM